MARRSKLKVYRTPIGFHDAYVAAPSQKAALEAWGSDSNLFAQGIAEQVADSELMKDALERPGEVIRKLRGSKQEQDQAAKSAKPRARGQPRPSRSKPKRAEKALRDAEQRRQSELEKLRSEQQDLDRRRRDLEQEFAREREKLSSANRRG